MRILEYKNPDIVLLDIRMPDINGLEALKLIKERYPSIKTIIYSSQYSEYYFKEVILLGANSYIPKSASSETVLDTIKKVALDGYSITKEISKEILSGLIEQKKLEYLISDRILTSREIEILRLISEGYTYKQVADMIFISVNTVKFHIKAIHKKTEQSTLAALIKYAIRVGISDIEEPLFSPNS